MGSEYQSPICFFNPSKDSLTVWSTFPAIHKFRDKFRESCISPDKHVNNPGYKYTLRWPFHIKYKLQKFRAHKDSTGPIAHKDSTGPIAHKKSTGPIAHKDSTGLIAHKNSTGPIAHKKSTGPIAHKKSTGIISVNKKIFLFLIKFKMVSRQPKYMYTKRWWNIPVAFTGGTS